MNCLDCTDKICRTHQASCGRENFVRSEIIEQYRSSANNKIVQTAAKLVDNGRAGSLSRLQEIIEYAKSMNYSKLGLAYCYGMEKTAGAIQTLLTNEGLSVTAIGCSVGGLEQSEVNTDSCIHKVSCNPMGQAYQLNEEKVDLTLIVGICLGHDILLQRKLEMDFTTLIVKDRVNNHNPIAAIKKINKN